MNMRVTWKFREDDTNDREYCSKFVGFPNLTLSTVERQTQTLTPRGVTLKFLWLSNFCLHISPHFSLFPHLSFNYASAYFTWLRWHRGIVYLEVFTDCGRGLSSTCLSQATQWRQSTWRTAVSFQTLTIRYVTSLVGRGATGRERYNVQSTQSSFILSRSKDWAHVTATC